MKKHSVMKALQKPIAFLAAAALTLSMFGCGAQNLAGDQSSIGEEAAPLADGDTAAAASDALSSDSDAALVIKAGAAVQDTTNPNKFKWPNLTVTAKDPTKKIKSITVQFTSEIKAADEITFTDSGNFVVFNKDKHGNKSVNNEAGATAAEWQEYLRKNMVITLADLTGDTAAKSLRMIASFEKVDATYDYWSGNGHYYKYVYVQPTSSTSTSISWSDALEAAEADSYLGLRGYLVTVTSDKEMAFINSLVNARTWLGGTCWPKYTSEFTGSGTAISEKKYFWASGPEKGTAISIGSSSVSGAYTNWTGSEPNNSSGIGKDKKGGSDIGEYCLHMYDTTGYWNDYPNYPDSGSHWVHGYVIEYGGMPEDEDPQANADASLDLEVEVKVDIKLDPTGQTMTTDVNDVYVGQPLSIKENVNGGDVMTKKDGIDVQAEITRTFKKLSSDGKTWVDIPDSELVNGLPAHAGTYQVTSAADYSVTGSSKVAYKTDPATFKIKPLPLTPEITKVYDGTTSYTVSALDVSDLTLPNAQVTMTADSAVTFNAATVEDASEVYLTNVKLEGADKADYTLPPLNKDNKYVVKGKITPRELTITAIASVNWGLEDQELKDGAGTAVAYKTDLAIHKSGDWKPNELAERDAKSVDDTILGALTFTKQSGSTALDEKSPKRGLYTVEAHFANVNKAATSTADNGKSSQSLAMMAEEGETATEASTSASGSGSASTLDTITATKTSDGKYDIGNYLVTFVDDSILITDNPLTENSYDEATTFLGGTASAKLNPDAKPLEDADLLAILKEALGSDLPAGTPTFIVTDKDGNPVDKIDPTKAGSYAIVATYTNPDGKDTVVRVGYNVLENDPKVIKQEVTVAKQDDATPVSKDNLVKLIDGIMGNWELKGTTPTVTITGPDNKQCSEIDLSKAGTYNVTLDYVGEDGQLWQVQLAYTVSDTTDKVVTEDIIVPVDPNGSPISKDDVFDRIKDSYPGIVPDGIKDYKIVITDPDGNEEDALDPTKPGKHVVTIEYTDPVTGQTKLIQTTYNFQDLSDDQEGKVGEDDENANGNDNENDNENLDKQLSGTDPAAGASGTTGTSGTSGTTSTGSKGWDDTSGSKGFADTLLAQTGDPMFWVICGVIVVAVVAVVVLVVSRKKNKQ